MRLLYSALELVRRKNGRRILAGRFRGVRRRLFGQRGSVIRLLCLRVLPGVKDGDELLYPIERKLDPNIFPTVFGALGKRWDDFVGKSFKNKF